MSSDRHLALAKIVDYLTRAAAIVRRIDRNVTEPIELGGFPLEATIDLQNCLRWAEQPEAEQIWQLLASIQIFQSRYVRSFKGVEREQCQIYLCELLTKTERLFDYGRNGHLEPKMTRGEIDHAVFLLRLKLVAETLLDYYRSSLPPDPDGGESIIDETEVG